MKKYIRFIAVFATLVLGFSVYKKEDSNVYAIELENKIDLLLLMSVNPGFGGQKFMPHVLEKACAARKILDSWDNPVRLQIDGGVNLENIGEIATTGVDTFVAGVIFRHKASEYSSVISELKYKVNNNGNK